ncbi:hypothetical protein [Macrococcoides canis]|uniref:Uncharacterized protein n=1 Tax=Macrococcoides canis TaxID=1855823 RepID=A0A1W7ADN6_9STAP|nr:hypothetical protein [Macrococcus canis]ARQ07719.1 hypothetical protein MCCS_21300 [Macrococcus canis]MCO4097517.1 hypothetical protein [Macrococcus canis]MEE1106935.1 hypothetical protein [Macrococcus canis]QTQ07752.1 hypothetical protein J9174_10190 [Macrococcus canis]UJS27409.1 hypothetical protein L2Z53_09735 [Macrococcus canis]
MELIKGLFKAVFIFALVLSVILTAGAALFFISFKKDFEDIERRTKEIVAQIESENA